MGIFPEFPRRSCLNIIAFGSLWVDDHIQVHDDGHINDHIDFKSFRTKVLIFGQGTLIQISSALGYGAWIVTRIAFTLSPDLDKKNGGYKFE